MMYLQLVIREANDEASELEEIATSYPVDLDDVDSMTNSVLGNGEDSTPACVDYDDECDKWAADGFCETNQVRTKTISVSGILHVSFLLTSCRK